MKDFFPRRTDVLLELYRSEGLFPAIDAPIFSEHGGVISSNSGIGLSASNGTIYYTIDGRDPRLSGGGIADSASAFTDPIQLSSDATIKARAFHEGEWSALNQAHFMIASELPLRVSEINFNPHDARLVDALTELQVDNDQFEFIELTNIGDQPIDLKGVRFLETRIEFESNGMSFVFADQQLQPGQAIVVVQDREAFTSRYGADTPIAVGNDGVGGRQGEFAGELSNDGEVITLMDSSGRIIQQFDYSGSIESLDRTRGYGSSLQIVDPGESYENETNWIASSQFGGSPGVTATSAHGDVVINEVKAKDAPASDGWIELYNATERPIDVGGWYLSDAIGDLFKFQVTDGITIAGDGYQTISQSQFGFGLHRARGGHLWLIESDDQGVPLRFVDQVQVATSVEGTTVGRSLAELNRMIPLSQSTLNSRNRLPDVGDIVVSEVHFHSPDLDGEGTGQQANNFEYIELLNRSEVEIDLSGWRLTGDVDLSFRRGPILGPGETALAVSFAPNRSTQANPFREAHGIDRSVPLAGPYLGRLNNSHGTVRIERPLEPMPSEPFFSPYLIVDEVMFDSQQPWPESPGGSGDTLTRINARALGKLASSWTGAPPTPGRSDLSIRLTGDANEDGRFDTGDLVHAMQGGKYETAVAATFAEGDWNRDGVFDSEDLLMAAATDRFEAAP